jgi:hypothetical protein
MSQLNSASFTNLHVSDWCGTPMPLTSADNTSCVETSCKALNETFSKELMAWEGIWVWYYYCWVVKEATFGMVTVSKASSGVWTGVEISERKNPNKSDHWPPTLKIVTEVGPWPVPAQIQSQLVLDGNVLIDLHTSYHKVRVAQIGEQYVMLFPLPIVMRGKEVVFR